MTSEEISKYAYRAIKPPNTTELDEWLYYTLRDNYQSYRDGTIDKQDAADHKQSAIRRYEQLQSWRVMADGIVTQHANMWKDIESAATAYHSERTLDNADRFVNAVYGLKDVT